MDGTVVGVVGARGGAGASLVACALAAAWRADRGAGRPAVTLVDLEVRGGACEVRLGLERSPGLRWQDLLDARGGLDGRALVARLPAWRGVSVLASGGGRSGAPDPPVVVDVCAALAAVSGVMVLDVPRPWLAAQDPARADAAGPLLGACDTVLVVTPLDLVSVAGALATRDALHEAGTAALALVARRPSPGGLSPWEVSDAVGLPLATTVGWDPRLDAAVERGEGPPVRGRTPLARAGRQLVTRLPDPARTTRANDGPVVRAGARPALDGRSWP